MPNKYKKIFRNKIIFGRYGGMHTAELESGQIRTYPYLTSTSTKSRIIIGMAKKKHIAYKLALKVLRRGMF